jgi:N-acetyl-anhydromuramyl-L-alanine amidase AmpD
MAKKAAKRAVAVIAHAGNGSNNPHSKPAITQFIQSPNHSSRNGAPITMVVLHCTEASLASTLETFQDGDPNGRQVSAHYVVDRNGDIYQMVSDSDRANHCKGANQTSIGIEHVGSPTQTLADAQSSASADLVRWLLEQYGIPRNRVFGHDFAPGYSGGGTSCPDALFGGAHTQAAVDAWVAANV